MLINRKKFLQIGSIASASLAMPKFLRAFEPSNIVADGNKVFVIIQLSGGNDGLNTIVPISNDIYYRSRSKIGIKPSEALNLSNDAGLHPSLTAFKDFYEDGSLGILNSVGYPNPDRSHFRSMDIWHTASNSREYLNTGWIGRYLDAQCNNCKMPTQALEIDDTLSLSLKGEQQSGLAFTDPKKLYGTSYEKFYKDIVANHKHGQHDIDFLYKTMVSTINSADNIFTQSKLNPSKQIYPDTKLGKGLKTIASLIMSDINTKVYYISLGSFDTHVGQEAQQKRLFIELNNAVKSFTDDLKKNNRFNDVMIMTFSEFGRRVAQNASNGTDHGTANNMFLIGGALKKKGILNDLPNLDNLQDGDLKHEVDFKNVYATILNKWLDSNDKLILGKQYSYLDFI